MPEYIIQRLEDYWSVKGSADTASFTFTVCDPDTLTRYAVTFGVEKVAG